MFGDIDLWGGALATHDLSTVTATDCKMTSNSASSYGGAVCEFGGSTFIATDSTFIGNSVHYWGGAIMAFDRSNGTAMGCVMTSNSASGGAALFADHAANVVAADCTMTSNVADRGGAVNAADHSTVLAIHCTMTSNSAAWGGAVVAGGGTIVTTADSQITVANCFLALNYASLGGAAMFVDVGGTVDLANSVLESNVCTNDTDNGVGIVSYGQVQCDATIGCLPVCTVCQDVAPSLRPTSRPTAHVSATPATSRKRETDEEIYNIAFVALSALALAASVSVVRLLVWHYKFDRDAHQPGGEGVEIHNMLRSPLTDIDADVAERSSANDDTSTKSSHSDEHSLAGIRVPLPWSAIGSSPGLIFAIDRKMRVVSWSAGACDSCRLWYWFLAVTSVHFDCCTCLLTWFCRAQGCRPLSRCSAIHVARL